MSSSSSSSSSTILDSSLLNGLGGLSHGSFFRISDSVNVTKSPGNASAAITEVSLWRESILWKILTFHSFFYSPNLTWFLMACITWYMYPYPSLHTDESTTSTEFHQWQDLFQNRLLFNLLSAYGYIGFWHVALYKWNWCHRPFVSDRVYRIQKVLHNMLYTTWGVLHWTAVEVAFVYCYQTKRLPIVVNSATTISARFCEFGTMLLLAFWIPSFRDVHFYFTHRMIHVRWLYKYVHSVHHRNTDVEPFSGLAMHPIEHLYYFTCYAPFLLPTMLSTTSSYYAPFLLFWMAFHTALSPAASHSGWEDHFSSDWIHYLHHRYCDCNYAAGINLDAYFGTYQACIRGSSNTSNIIHSVEYTNDNTTNSDSNGTTNQQEAVKQQATTSRQDPKATLERWWQIEHAEYQFGILGMVTLSLWAYSHSLLSPLGTAIVLTAGPAVLALLLSIATRPSSLSWRKTLLAPFDKDPWWSILLHFSLGTLLGVVPATYLLYLILS